MLIVRERITLEVSVKYFRTSTFPEKFREYTFLVHSCYLCLRFRNRIRLPQQQFIDPQSLLTSLNFAPKKSKFSQPGTTQDEER